jgi:hypothetical protein
VQVVVRLKPILLTDRKFHFSQVFFAEKRNREEKREKYIKEGEQIEGNLCMFCEHLKLRLFTVECVQPQCSVPAIQ